MKSRRSAVLIVSMALGIPGTASGQTTPTPVEGYIRAAKAAAATD